MTSNSDNLPIYGPSFLVIKSRNLIIKKLLKILPFLTDWIENNNSVKMVYDNILANLVTL